MSRLGSFWERVVEAGWLAAIVVVPLYFNVYSSRVFEPDKIAILRSIVAVMLVGQIVVWADRGRAGQSRGSLVAWLRGAWSSNPLALPVALVILTELIATVASINPSTSLFGSYQRLQGGVTLLTYVGIFLLLIAHLRTENQLGRLLQAIVLTSIPISFYGVIQHLQLDPLPWGGDVIDRVSSTMGNSIFLGAYLIMVIPVTAAMLVGSIRRARAEPDVPTAPVGAACAYWATAIVVPNLLLVALVIFHSQIFGIWWATTGVIGFFVLVAGHRQDFPRSKQLARLEAAGLAAALALQVVCAFLTQSRGPLAGLLIGAELFVLWLVLRPPRRRDLVTAVVVAFLAFNGLVVAFNVPGLPLAQFRSLPYVGRFGELTDLTSGTGLVRALIWQGAVDLFIHHQSAGLAPDPLNALRPLIGYGPETIHLAYNKVYPPALGDIESRNAAPDRLHNDSLDHLLTTGVVGLAAFYFLVVAALVVAWQAYRRSRNERDALLAIGIVSALVAHFVEMQTGIAIVSTISYFWIFLAIVVVAATRQLDQARPWPPVMAGGAPTAGEARRQRRERARAAAAAPVPVPPRRQSPGFVWFLAVYLVVVGIGQAIVSGVASANASLLTIVAFAWLALAMGVWAYLEARDDTSARPAWNARTLLATGIAGVVALFVIVANLNQVAADVYYKQGTLFDTQQLFGNSAFAYEQAIALAPTQDYYYLFLGRSYLEQAKVATTPSTGRPFSADLASVLALTPNDITLLGRLENLEAAQTVLRNALALDPLDPDHYANMARLYRLWGENLDKSKLALSEQYYAQATTVSPNTAQLYDEWAMVLLDGGKTDEAMAKAVKAEQLDPAFELTHVVTGDVALAQKQYDQALAEYRWAEAINPDALSDPSFEQRVSDLLQGGQGPQLAALYQNVTSQHPDSFTARSADAFILAKTGNLPGALAQYQALVKMRPDDWLSWKNMALTDQGLGNLQIAIGEAQQAAKYAPQDQQQSIADLIAALQKQHS